MFQVFGQIQRFGAGEGNRTLVVSLGSCCSAIELHPHFNDLAGHWRGSLRSGFQIACQAAREWHQDGAVVNVSFAELNMS